LANSMLSQSLSFMLHNTCQILWVLQQCWHYI